MALNKHIHIGISGWSYPDWKGVFYPEKMKSAEWLTFYAQHFDTTEINMSFYHLPKKQTVINWVEKVPKHFLFCPKMSRYLTHIKRLREPEEPLQRFFDVFGPMEKQLGPILLQLPPSLKFEEDIISSFFDILKHEYGQYKFALEARHESWLHTDVAKLLHHYDVAWVISQSGVGFPYSEQVTARNVYFRFHGPGKLYASSYDDETLLMYAEQFRKWNDEGHYLWIYFNNCYNGVAIDNANVLRGYLSPALLRQAQDDNKKRSRK